MAEAEAERAEMVQVACRVRGGLILQLTEPRDDGTGFKQMRKVGPKFVVAGPPGVQPMLDMGVVGTGELGDGTAAAITEVPAGFWSEWLEQNNLNPLVVEGLIGQWEPAEAREPDEAPAAKD
jgi:hypothetical protein